MPSEDSFDVTRERQVYKFRVVHGQGCHHVIIAPFATQVNDHDSGLIRGEESPLSIHTSDTAKSKNRVIEFFLMHNVKR